MQTSSTSTRPSLDDGPGMRSMFPTSTGSLAEGTFRAEGCFNWVINRSDLVRAGPDAYAFSTALVGAGSEACEHAGRRVGSRPVSLLAAML